MKMRSLIAMVIMVCAFASPYSSFAQGNPGPDPDTRIPFDGGLSLLVAAGVGYGFKKAYNKRKKENEPANAEDNQM
jgi:hypothetical protein